MGCLTVLMERIDSDFSISTTTGEENYILTASEEHLTTSDGNYVIEDVSYSGMGVDMESVLDWMDVDMTLVCTPTQ